MKQLVDKLASVERAIASEKGPLSLFGLFLRKDGEDKWDLLVSAPWLEKDKSEGLKYLVDQIHSQLDTQELLVLSRIVLLEKDNPVLEAINRTIRVQHKITEVRDTVFFGLPIEQAFLITSEAADASKS